MLLAWQSVIFGNERHMCMKFLNGVRHDRRVLLFVEPVNVGGVVLPVRARAARVFPRALLNPEHHVPCPRDRAWRVPLWNRWYYFKKSSRVVRS
nr:hypothetical protein [Candidatus Sigynarchaeum springense]